MIQTSFLIFAATALLTMLGFGMYLLFSLVCTMFINRRRKKNAPVRKLRIMGEDAMEERV